MDITSERIYMNLDSNLVHATGAYKDSTSKKAEGTPIVQRWAPTVRK